MNLADLFVEIKRRKGDLDAIYTGIGNPEDRYAIVQVGTLWKVYYSERGEKFELRDLIDEADACEYLLELLNKDETIWRGNVSGAPSPST